MEISFLLCDPETGRPDPNDTEQMVEDGQPHTADVSHTGGLTVVAYASEPISDEAATAAYNVHIQGSATAMANAVMAGLVKVRDGNIRKPPAERPRMTDVVDLERIDENAIHVYDSNGAIYLVRVYKLQ